MSIDRCPACRSQPLRTARSSDGTRICHHCGRPLQTQRAPSPLKALVALAVFAAVGAAAITAFSSTQTFKAQPRPDDRPLKPANDSALMAVLDQADESWRPRAQSLPGGGIRYTYKRRQDDPPLDIEQIKLLILYPPRFDRERAAIAAQLGELRSRGCWWSSVRRARQGRRGNGNHGPASCASAPMCLPRGARNSPK
ncbi:hypothetical protein [Cyanobium sp. ATX-6F1]|uniref:hypothetical protein n=1 Tax=Cyanobium sp. ATX-6F1 TaxID=3137388 RepID=UPI0039BE5086